LRHLTKRGKGSRLVPQRPAIGFTSLAGRLERYAARFDHFELRIDPGREPGNKLLTRYRASVPERFSWSVLLPPSAVGPALENPDLAEPGARAAEALGARLIVIQTGPEMGPSARSLGRLSKLSERLGGVGAWRVGWEPHGPWEPERAREVAEERSLVLVEDLTQVEAPPSPVVYTRLRALGRASGLGETRLERLASGLAGAAEATVIIEGPPSNKVRARILRALSDQAELGDLEELGEDDEDAGEDIDDEEE
jgi:uncharacterized protein YecE (DUF72 family)